MTSYMKSGFRAAVQQPFAVIVLFLYQLGWGMALYKMVQSVLVPLMHRFPGSSQPKLAMQLFLAEGQFQLFKTDVSYSYLWTLVILLGVRMLLTPMLNAGIYYSITHTEQNAGYRFFKGIRELSLSFFLCYAARVALTMLPLIWLIPEVQSIYAHSTSYESAALSMLPWLGGLLAYGFILHLLFMHVQFALALRSGIIATIGAFLRHLLPIVTIALLLVIGSGLLAGVTVTATYIWAGLLALMIYQLFPLFNMFLQMWALTSQYHLWSAKNNS
ncbi:hypothetical protein [Paenibacillus hexagrammi]|uniref:Uncharacterized protein n=1 Tax=Paenibacillus hexagrammi TaxID=2908839 RepID=A0ABY3SKK9_9BACL|nr:hypothetical protein [Paenibacillus sp. YPD9-1]UJF33631.1 hypothetical protein L0M14_29830 [Paenibacillus sp. YPD9-1]